MAEEDHVEQGNDGIGRTGTGETMSGERLVAGNQDVVVLAPETSRSTAGDEVLQQKKTAVNGGGMNERRREKEKTPARTRRSP
jgi:hypothetical protein